MQRPDAKVKLFILILCTGECSFMVLASLASESPPHNCSVIPAKEWVVGGGASTHRDLT